MSPLAIFFICFVFWTQTANAICPCMQQYMGVDLSGFAKPASTSSLAPIASAVPSSFAVPLNTVANSNAVASGLTASNIPSGFSVPLTTVSSNNGLANPAINGLGFANARLGNLGLVNGVGAIGAGLTSLNTLGGLTLL